MKAEAVSIKELQQDGRLAPAYFSPNYRYFDQLLQTVKNKTTVLILVFKEFSQTSIPPLIFVLYAKGYQYYPLKNFCLTVPKSFVEEPFCVSESFWYRKKIMHKRGGGGREYHDFLWKIFCLTVPKNFLEEPFCVSQNFWYRKKIMHKRGGGGREYHDFLWKIFCLTVPKNFAGEPFWAVFQKFSGSEKVYG